MAHFARLNSQNKVVEVVSAPDNIDEETLSTETGQKWKQTSYNTRENVHILGGTPFRKNYAGIGYKYYSSHDGFAPPKPYTSWTLDGTTCTWHPPMSKPDDGNFYEWNEDELTWDLIS